MATSIQLLRSNIAQLRPDPATLAEGMPMVNLNETEPGLFFRLRDGSLAKIGPVSVGVLAPNSSAQGFAGNSIGEQWVDTTDPTAPTLKIWDGTAWLSASGGGSGQKGDKGTSGTNGTGTKGEKGATGLSGSAGASGIKGQKGEANDKGEKGNAQQILTFEGTANTPGDIPATGNVLGSAYYVISTGTYHAWDGSSWLDVGSISKGEVGVTGQKGQQGIKGTIGVTGATGAKGRDGAQGVQGNPGVNGSNGIKGEKGIGGAGAKGDVGPKGEVGDKGLKGDGAAALPGLYFRGNVANTGALPAGASPGDTYNVIDINTYYTWDGSQWWDIGQISKGEKGLKGLDGNGTKGEKGDASSVAGAAATVDAGTTTTLPSTLQASVTNSGTTSAAIFDFSIPKGEVGPKGDFGTVAVGTVTTVSSLNPATIVNSGSATNAVLDFDIPKGEKGLKGQKGQKGLKGIKGQKGANGNKGQKGEEGPVAGTAGQVIFNLDGINPGGDPDFTYDAATDTLATPDIVTTGDVEVRNSPTQDGVKLAGRPGGTSDFDVTIIPDPLSADRTLVLPDEDGVFVTTGSADVITSGMIVDNEILNQDINAAAGIEVSKLEDMVPGTLIVGDATSNPTIVPMSGDATLSDTGQIDVIDDVNLGGDPTTTTQLTTDDSTKIATTAFVQQRVDEAIQGLDVKTEVRATTTGANITLSTLQTIDGVVLAVGDRVLVKDQTNPNDNGIYEASAGAWTRPSDADDFSELVGAFVFTSEGTINVDSGFFCQAQPGGTIGANPIPWTQFSGAGQIIAGGGMTKAGNQLDVNSADPTRIVVNGDDIDLATTAVAAGSYREITVDTYGRAVAGSNPTTFAGYGLSDTSAALAAALTDETGTGSAVFSDSPVLTGTPTSPTPAAGDNSNTLATTAYVDSASSSLPLNNGDLLIGNVANVGIAQTMSGDATIDNAGVITIAAGAVDSGKILDGSIATVDIGDNQVTNAKILDGSVTTTKVADGSITTAKILDGTIATVDLADNSVTTIKILNAAVTTAKLGDNSVTSAKIVDGTIDTDDLADASVTSAKIADLTIVNADIANSTIQGGKLAPNIVIPGSPSTVTQPQNDNSDNLATTEYTDRAVTTAFTTITTLNDANIYVGDATNTAVGVPMTGDATIANTGLITIATDVALAGNPTTTTQAPADNSTRIATTAYVENAVLSGDVSLNNGNIFVGDASNVAVGVTMSGDATIDNAGVVTLVNDLALIGNPTTVTQLQGDNSTRIANTAYVDNFTPSLQAGEIFVGDASNRAASTAMTGVVTISNTGVTTITNDAAFPGNPTTTTQLLGTADTTIATTAFVTAAISAGGSTIADGDILVGNAANVGTAVTMSGDATIINTGAITIKNDVALAGNPTTTTQAAGTNDTTIATTAFVADGTQLNSARFLLGDAANVTQKVAMSGDATLSNTGQLDIIDNVNLGGSPTTTTQALGTNNTTIATTAYVDTASLWVLDGTTIEPDTDGRDVVPVTDGGASLGGATLRWANVFTQDMHFSNEGTSGNDVDGTTGNWTLQEGQDHIFFINNKTGVKFRVVMEQA